MRTIYSEMLMMKLTRVGNLSRVESVNGSNEDELRAGRSMQGHRKGEVQIH